MRKLGPPSDQSPGKFELPPPPRLPRSQVGSASGTARESFRRQPYPTASRESACMVTACGLAAFRVAPWSAGATGQVGRRGADATSSRANFGGVHDLMRYAASGKSSA